MEEEPPCHRKRRLDLVWQGPTKVACRVWLGIVTLSMRLRAQNLRREAAEKSGPTRTGEAAGMAGAMDGAGMGRHGGIDGATATPGNTRDEDLPDSVQGWFLLEKNGLDPLERSVIQGDLRSNFTLHWTDEQVRRRDGDPKHYASFQDADDECSDPEPEPDDAFFESWTESEKAWWQEAREEEHTAWVQLQNARRTLKEARAKQHEVKLGRRFYKPKGQGKSRSHPIGSNPRQGPCLRCGKGHATAECPNGSSQVKSAAYVEEPEHLAEFTFYRKVEDDLEGPPQGSLHAEGYLNEQFEPEEQSLAAWPSRMITEEAIQRCWIPEPQRQPLTS